MKPSEASVNHYSFCLQVSILVKNRLRQTKINLTLLYLFSPGSQEEAPDSDIHHPKMCFSDTAPSLLREMSWIVIVVELSTCSCFKVMRKKEKEAPFWT